jgi:hypothetical protein
LSEQEQTSASNSGRLRRRGLLAGVAALVAGALGAASERVAQAAGTQGTSLVCGEDNTSTGPTFLTRARSTTRDVVSEMESPPGALRVSWESDFYELKAALEGVSDNAIGIFGRSVNNYGVRGFSQHNPGVVGTSTNNHGVYGLGQQGVGVYGASYYGHNIGVFGRSENSAGMHGVSTNSVGVYGLSTNGAAVVASSSSGTSPALYAVQFGTAPAARLVGDVTVEGALTVGGAAISTVVAHPDGSRRRLYSLTTAEGYVEDFGRAALVDGRADVALDLDFAALVGSDDYDVFLTPCGDCRGLYVSEQRPAAFAVRELQGGTASLPFSYRVVARRRDVPTPRLERVAPSPPLNVGSAPPLQPAP